MQKNNENRIKNFVKKNKIILILLALFLFIGIATPITYAYLQDNTPGVTNTFTPGEVGTEVDEKFENNIKSDVKIKNTKNVPAYIRAALIVNWVDTDGNYAAEAPVINTDYNMNINTTDWFEKDGYYYHRKPVDPDNSTSVLINSAKPISEKNGYKLSIEILGSGIQAMPEKAVKETWNIQVIDGQLGGGE